MGTLASTIKLATSFSRLRTPLKLPIVHPVIFDSLDAKVIRSADLHTFGSEGPTGTDAHCWKRKCSAFGHCPDELCHALAMFAH